MLCKFCISVSLNKLNDFFLKKGASAIFGIMYSFVLCIWYSLALCTHACMHVTSTIFSATATQTSMKLLTLQFQYTTQDCKVKIVHMSGMYFLFYSYSSYILIYCSLQRVKCELCWNKSAIIINTGCGKKNKKHQCFCCSNTIV